MAEQIDERMNVLSISGEGVAVDGSTVILLVGSEERPLIAHEADIRAHSGFFEAALSQRWKEGRERVIQLPEDRPDQIKLYLQWLYSGRIHTKLEASAGLHQLLGELYVLGGKLIDAEFQNCVIDAMIAASRKPASDGMCYWAGPNVIKLIYDNTSKSSPARRMMVDYYVSKGKAQWISDFPNPSEIFSCEFIEELSIALLRDRIVLHRDKKNYAHFKYGVPCVYHIHDNGKECPQMKTESSTTDSW